MVPPAGRGQPVQCSFSVSNNVAALLPAVHMLDLMAGVLKVAEISLEFFVLSSGMF